MKTFLLIAVKLSGPFSHQGQVPSFVHNAEQDESQGQGLVGGICIDWQVINSENLFVDCSKVVWSICWCDVIRNLLNIWYCGACFPAQLRCSGKN